MGLSVLIPVYRYDAGLLVKELHAQLVKLGIDFEIVVLDDSADEATYGWASHLSSLPNFYLIKQTKNLGRSRARNVLRAHARFDQLLYLDGDMQPTQNFIANFWTLISQKPQAVWVGKVDYAADNSSLRAAIGRKKESIAAAIRNKNPYSGFSTAVCAFPKQLGVHFPENIKGYGHEDSWFGLLLKNVAYEVHHCDVAAIHMDNDSDSTFLNKSAEAAENLALLYLRESLFQQYAAVFPLIRFYQKLPFIKLWLGLVTFFPFRFVRWLVTQTQSAFLFDLLKLFYFLAAIKKSKSTINSQ